MRAHNRNSIPQHEKLLVDCTVTQSHVGHPQPQSYSKSQTNVNLRFKANALRGTSRTIVKIPVYWQQTLII